MSGGPQGGLGGPQGGVFPQSFIASNFRPKSNGLLLHGLASGLSHAAHAGFSSHGGGGDGGEGGESGGLGSGLVSGLGLGLAGGFAGGSAARGSSSSQPFPLTRIITGGGGGGTFTMIFGWFPPPPFNTDAGGDWGGEGQGPFGGGKYKFSFPG